jgi:hypothetical protein
MQSYILGIQLLDKIFNVYLAGNEGVLPHHVQIIVKGLWFAPLTHHILDCSSMVLGYFCMNTGHRLLL